MSRARLVAAALLLCGCAEPLAPGTFGVFRYAGNVKGDAAATDLALRPQLLPPLSDRSGNAYVLSGGPDVLEALLFVGHAGGGWAGGCQILGGNQYGVHGWVGRSETDAWYWSGEALVAASGFTGGCHRVLEADPASGAKLRMRAIVPWVRDTPTRTSTVAWIQAATDPAPFQVLVDLDNDVYTGVQSFDPPNATDVEVLGVGGDLEAGEGVVLTRFRVGESVSVEAQFVDFDGNTSKTARVDGLEMLPEYGIAGYLQPGEAGLYAGVGLFPNETTVEQRLVIVDRSGGETVPIAGMTAAGVHEWEGKLWLVGHNDGSPVVAEIDVGGDIGKIEKWDASREAQSELGSRIEVLDDRALPTRPVSWDDPRNAAGPAIFVSPHRLDHYADGTTTWLVAGPDFESGGDTQTAIAYAPVGVSYP